MHSTNPAAYSATLLGTAANPSPPCIKSPAGTLIRTQRRLCSLSCCWISTIGVSYGNCISTALKPSAAAQAKRSKNGRSEEHTSELQSRPHLVCRLLLEKKKKKKKKISNK